MAYEQILQLLGEYQLDFNAYDVGTYQYTAVTLGNAVNAAGTGQGRAALQQPAAGAAILGVLQINGVINTAAPVAVAGITRAKISINATAGHVGDLMAVDATGGFVKAASGTFAVGMAVEDYVPGQIGSLLLGKYGKQ